MNNSTSGHSFLEQVRCGLHAFLHDCRGLSAVEFALIIPLMIPLYFGAVEFSNALTVDRRVTSVASTAADLTAQAEEVTSGDIQDVFDAARSIMTPYPNAGISIVLTSVVADEDNKTTVDWSCAQNGTAYSEGSNYTLPTNLTQPFSSVIVAEVAYTYSPPIVEFITTPINMTETFYLRPRRSLTVEFQGGGC